jgi:hypothetical protein
MMSIKSFSEKVLGISEAAGRAAAKRGEIPTIKIGKLIRVPVALGRERWRQAADKKEGES